MSANVARSGPLVIERILRDRQGIWRQIVEERDLNALTGRMLASSAVALACYGAVLGAFHSFLMALTSAVKLPMLFLITLAICLPTLYLFNLVFGARLSVRQALAMVMVAITVTSMLAVAFAPISLFFLITAPDYNFFKLLNVAILTLSALVGLRFLTGGMQVLNEHGLLAPAVAVENANGHAPAAAPVGQPAATTAPGVTEAQAVAVGAAVGTIEGGAGTTETGATTVTSPTGNGAAPTATGPVPVQAVPAGYTPVGYAQPAGGLLPVGYPPAPVHPLPGQRVPLGRPMPVTPAQRPASMTLLYIWILLFGFVGTQLAWTLRPFFGSPGEPFQLFRSIEGNFYAEILRTLGNLF